jgi:hypothetical protein
VLHTTTLRHPDRSRSQPTVSGAAEGPPHFAFAVALVVACPSNLQPTPKNGVIPTEAAHGFIVSSAAEKICCCPRGCPFSSTSHRPTGTPSFAYLRRVGFDALTSHNLCCRCLSFFFPLRSAAEVSAVPTLPPPIEPESDSRHPLPKPKTATQNFSPTIPPSPHAILQHSILHRSQP